MYSMFFIIVVLVTIFVSFVSYDCLKNFTNFIYFSFQDFSSFEETADEIFLDMKKKLNLDFERYFPSTISNKEIIEVKEESEPPEIFDDDENKNTGEEEKEKEKEMDVFEPPTSISKRNVLQNERKKKGRKGKEMKETSKVKKKVKSKIMGEEKRTKSLFSPHKYDLQQFEAFELEFNEIQKEIDHSMIEAERDFFDPYRKERRKKERKRKVRYLKQTFDT